ncbi:MAG TPA: 3'-5' exonuclease [Paenisporosarcina sp.]|nr:3'-5' exonuclease [Paenisporosarcina sp.]
MNGFIIYVVDVESTGLDPTLHEIIEISMCRLTPKDDGSYDEEQKSWLLKALNPKTIQDEALRINGHKREDILWISKFGKENYRLPNDVVDEIESWMMTDNVSSIDRIFAGQNPTFDVEHMKTLWKRCGRENEDDFPFFVRNNNRIIDTKMIMAFFDICTGRRRKFYNLGGIVKALGVKKGKAHKADEDVRMTKDVLLKLVTIIQPVVAEQFKDCYPDDEEM